MARDYSPGDQLHLSALSEESRSALHAATLEILERTGIFLESRRAQEILRGAGARVDGSRVHIPSFLVEDAIRSAPERVTICNRDGERYMLLEGNRSYFTGVSDAPFLLDPYSQGLRAFTSADYVSTSRVIDACPNLWGAIAGGSAVDYPAEVRGQVAFKYTILNTKKPYGACPLDAQQMSDVYDMAAAIAGGYDRLRQAPFVIATAEPTSPLSIFKEASEILMLAAEQNMPLVWYPMPSAGTTAPASPAAILAVGNAEILAGLVLHQLVRKGAPFIYGIQPGMTDMRSTQWAYGSPDLASMVAAVADLAHGYGLPVFSMAGCSDAQALDAQAVAESTMLCLTMQLCGVNLIQNVGILAGCSLLSPELMVLCDEIVDMVDHATRPIDTSPEELALDLIDHVGPQGNYLALDHTLANFRRFWHSDIFLRNRLSVSGEDEYETVAERINKKTRNIIENHEVDPLPEDIIRNLDEMEGEWMGRYGFGTARAG
jgi:trimethylamine---corrinoid protein Co-methyltransferase